MYGRFIGSSCSCVLISAILIVEEVCVLTFAVRTIRLDGIQGAVSFKEVVVVVVAGKVLPNDHMRNVTCSSLLYDLCINNRRPPTTSFAV